MGRFLKDQKILPGVVNNLKSQGCDSVVLGCTEIPLIVLPDESPLPILDSTRILARAALMYSIGSGTDGFRITKITLHDHFPADSLIRNFLTNTEEYH